MLEGSERDIITETGGFNVVELQTIDAGEITAVAVDAVDDAGHKDSGYPGLEDVYGSVAAVPGSSNENNNKYTDSQVSERRSLRRSKRKSKQNAGPNISFNGTIESDATLK